MRFSFALALGGLLATFALACSQGEPADPETAPTHAPASASARSGGPSQAHAANGAPASSSDSPASGTNSAPTTSSSSSSSSSSGAPAQPPELTAQGVAGQKLFQDHCTRCHGGSVSVSSMMNAANAFRFISTNMPANAPGSLSESDYYSIVAFDLAETGVDLQGQTLDAANAPSISVP